MVENAGAEFFGERDRDAKASEYDRVDEDLPIEVNAAHVVLLSTISLGHNRL